MDFFKVITLEESKKMIKNNLLNKVVFAYLEDINKSSGKILAEDIISPECMPLYSRSTVDGYACNYLDTTGASSSIPSFLKNVGSIAIGENPNVDIKRGECCYIATGALIPNGANCVAMIENTEEINDEIAIYSPLKNNENTIIKGEELTPGSIVAKKGDVISPLLIGVLSSLGISKVPIYKGITTSIISTGNELISIDEKAENGKIRDVNSNLLEAYLSKNDIKVTNKYLVKDDEKELENVLIASLKESDVVLVSGGSSVGKCDITFNVLNKIGKLLFHGLAVKPGKPTMAFEVDGKLVIGLPGNPLAASFIVNEMFISSIYSIQNRKRELIKAKVKVNFPSSPGKLTFQPVRVNSLENGYEVEPVFLKSAHLFEILKADGYVIIKENKEGIYKDDIVEVVLF